MKTLPLKLRSHAAGAAAAAFTLPEALIAATVFALLLVGIISTNIFGLRWYLMSQTKLLASDSARKAIGRMSDELRNCGNVSVGNMTNSVSGGVTNLVFVAHVNGEPQTGNGLLINAASNASSFVLYFVNAPDQTLRRTTSATGTTTIIASTVINTNVFQLQNFQGTVLTNRQNNCVIHCLLQFYTPSPNSPQPDNYTLETAVAPRALN